LSLHLLPNARRRKELQFNRQGIFSVGLASGRDLGQMEDFARELEISGPLVAENGAVVSLKKSHGTLDLGYGGEYTRGLMEKLQILFPDSVEASLDNRYRSVDMMFRLDDLNPEELRAYLGEAILLDSSYTYHLVRKDVSKGSTIRRILPFFGGVRPEEVMVFGDAENDLSMFQTFSTSVLVKNPSVACTCKEKLAHTASFGTESCGGDGFAETIEQLFTCRLN